MTIQLLADLKSAIAGRPQPLIVCGAGVTMWSSGNSAPSWRELIKSGIKQARDINIGTEAWENYALERLDGTSVDDWLTVADEVTDFLGGDNGAEMVAWLQHQLGDLRLKNRELVDAIFNLECPVATTNYDNLLTEASGKPPISWTDSATALRVARGDTSGIIHLHGMLTSPSTIVLGRKSYNELKEKSDVSLFRVAQSLGQPTLYIGCSLDGITDPDFSNIESLLTGLTSAVYRKYILVKDCPTAPQSDASTGIFPLPFGKDYAELPIFIRNLGSDASNENNIVNLSHANVTHIQPKTSIFGRELELNSIRSKIIEGGHAVISGAPGIGKTALAVNTLYSTDVVERFGDYRLFVSIEGTYDPRAIMYALVEAAGLVAQSDATSLLRQLQIFAQDKKVIAIIDNAEGVFEANFLEAERILSLICQIENIQIILTMRGVVPILENAIIIDDLQKLSLEFASQAFVSVSGKELGPNQLALLPLIEALDGHPLSINIIAAQARNVSADLLLEQWYRQKALLLRRRGQEEARLTSVRASLAISLDSRQIKDEPFSGRLISLLSELPDGLHIFAMIKLLSRVFHIDSARAEQAISILVDARLIETRPSGIARMLTPLRESAKLDKALLPIDRANMIRYYKKCLLNRTGNKYNQKIFDFINQEPSNVESICKMAFNSMGAVPVVFSMLQAYLSYASRTGRPLDSWLERSARHFIQVGRAAEGADLLDDLAMAEYMRGNVIDARRIYSAALPYVRGNKTTFIRNNILHGLGLCAKAEGISEQAEQFFEEALGENAGENCLPTHSAANALLGLAELAWWREDKALAESHLDRAFTIYCALGDEIGQANIKTYLARIVGRSPERLLNEALEVIVGRSFSASESGVQIMLGDYWFRKGDADKALSHYEYAMNSARSCGAAANESQAMIRSGQAKIALGQHNSGVHLVQDGFNLWFATNVGQYKSRVGFEYMRDAICATSQVHSVERLLDATNAWKSIGRNDLIEEWVEFRFGQDAAN